MQLCYLPNDKLAVQEGQQMRADTLAYLVTI